MTPSIIIPLSGLGSRFPKSEYHVYKPLILIDNRSIIEWSMSCIDYEGCNLIFVVRGEHIAEYAIDSFLKQKFPGAQIVIVPELTRGAAETCLAAKHLVDLNSPLFIHCSDVWWEPTIRLKDFQCLYDGCILTFKSNSSNYSYSKINEDGLVSEVAEKKVISNNASVGLYHFNRAEDFFNAAQSSVDNYSVGEIHVAPIYNRLIKDGKSIVTRDVVSFGVFGTPEEHRFFVKNTLKSFPANKKTVAVCSDHSGFKSKEIFKSLAARFNLECIDFGTYDTNDTDYNTFVSAACDSILKGQCDFGFGFCRSGQGVNIAANKIKGIRSSLCYNSWAANAAVLHNCANFFAMSEKHCGENEIYLALYEVMNTSFQGGRHQTRLMRSEA